MKITFFSIKTDTALSGFDIQIPRSRNDKVGPVQTLQDYIARTDSHRLGNGPVFLAQRSPFTALEAALIAKILEESIILAGLGGRASRPSPSCLLGQRPRLNRE